MAPRRRRHPRIHPQLQRRPSGGATRHLPEHGPNIPAVVASRPLPGPSGPPPGHGTPFDNLWRSITPSVGMRQFIMAVYNGSTAAYNHSRFVWDNVRHIYNAG